VYLIFRLLSADACFNSQSRVNSKEFSDNLTSSLRDYRNFQSHEMSCLRVNLPNQESKNFLIESRKSNQMKIVEKEKKMQFNTENVIKRCEKCFESLLVIDLKRLSICSCLQLKLIKIDSLRNRRMCKLFAVGSLENNACFCSLRGIESSIDDFIEIRAS
jgi:hypothetical protein